MNRIQKASIVFALAFAATNVAIAAPTEDSDSVFVAIDAAIQSLRQQPNQKMDVTCIGAQATANGGGIGISVTAIGGATGSQTTGMSVSMNGGQCSAMANTAQDALSQQAIKQLTDLKATLQAPTADKPTIMAELADLGKTYIAPALVAVLQGLVMKKLHL